VIWLFFPPVALVVFWLVFFVVLYGGILSLEIREHPASRLVRGVLLCRLRRLRFRTRRPSRHRPTRHRPTRRFRRRLRPIERLEER